MADVLSQAEVDALVSAYKATGGAEVNAKQDAKEVRLYDFARPDKFSKDHLKSLNAIHAKHGAAFAVALSARLRTQVQVDLLAVDQLTYREYCASVPDNTLLAEVSLDPLASTAGFEFNPVMVSACVDLLTGGVNPTSTASEITEIDRAVMRSVLDLSLKTYADAWANCVTFKPQVLSTGMDSNSRQILLPSEAVLVCGFEVGIAGSVSMMSICLPAAAVEAVLPALADGRTLNSQGRRYNGEDSSAITRVFKGVDVECRAILGRTTLRLEDIIELHVGDVIPLPVKANEFTELWVENVPVYGGVLGLSGRKLAMRLAKKIEEPV